MTEVYTVTVNNGTTEWRNSQGQYHRLGGLPAREYANGTKEWWVNDNIHRDNGLPAIELANGDKHWYVNGHLHRDNGLPAVECVDGYKAWWVNGKLHRDNGLPAVECVDGYKAWWVNGKRVTEQEAKAYGSHKEYTVAELETLLGQKIKIVR